ncbi:MAG: Rpn family recombination-promoting nuclease/putative transposase [Pigmentiphaga sp.]|nr:Rpn family recombination-promoting nuclease/putative transposase [Pigmentiphaga sp.]
MHQHDESYRLLFSNPTLVRSLFEGILDTPWLGELDWSRLEPFPTNYISDALKQRQGDLVWRLPRRDGRDLFLLLMIEHQSSNDRHMSLRMMTYLGLLYESLLAHKLIKLEQNLPAVLPLVIYSGASRWSAALNVFDLIDPVSPGLRRYQPQHRYLLVDEGALLESRQLPEDNLTALLFRLEHNRGLEDVQALIQRVYNYTQEDLTLRRAFASWTRYVLLPRALPKVDLPPTHNLLEIKTMLTDHSRSWTHQWKMEGLAEGRKEGRVEGQVELLHKQLARKFSPLPPNVEQRLHAATSETLEAWSLNLLDATTLDEVFRTAPPLSDVGSEHQ